jgi:hypothetical protein
LHAYLLKNHVEKVELQPIDYKIHHRSLFCQ